MTQQLVKKGQQISLKIKRLGINGEGIGYYKKLIIFVPGALPKEEVTATITNVTPKFAEGTLQSVKKAAKDRVVPPCPVYETCGGCQLQHLAYKAQLDFKKDLLNNSIVFRDTMLYQMAKLSKQSIQISMNELSNHDHSRFLTRTNKTVGRLHTLGYEAANRGINKGIMKEAVVIQMTWPGAPTIYYGDEVGVAGWTDPDNRRTYPWGKEDIDLLEFHKAVIKIHKQYSALKTGSLIFLYMGSVLDHQQP